ncbi:MAG: transposase [Blastocatellia bacterium]|nr:transposase [Blastocatellia bacterium]
MRTLSAELLTLIVVFQPLFTKPTWEHAKVLLLGVLLARGKRTVTACLRVVGLGDEEHFQNYHRVLNRAKWSGLDAARILLGLIVMIFASAPQEIIVLAGDDTIERRNGKMIKQLGCYRDPVRSSKKHTIKCFGLKWVALAVIVKLPWAARPWALPFFTVLCPAHPEGQEQKVSRYRLRRRAHKGKKRKSCAKTKTVVKTKFVATGKTPRRHKTAVDILVAMLRLAHRWMPQRAKVLVVDGGYAAIKLALTCVLLKNTALVMRFHWDATLHHPPRAKAEGQRGPQAAKGDRQRSPQEWARRKDTAWEEHEIDWYGGEKKKMLIFTRTALWYRVGYPPVAIRYVITRDPAGELRDEVFACTDTNASVQQIITWFVMRWGLEVTFEEAREHLGMETQRQWSDLAIARTTPILLGLFSLVTIFASKLKGDANIPVITTAWYQKREATFSDCLALVRKHLWSSSFHAKSALKADSVSLPKQEWEYLISCLSAVA